VRNWDRVAQPIQVSAKSRGIVHRQSQEVALKLRSLSVDLNNEHGMLGHTHRITEFLREIFAELPDMVERLDRDSETIVTMRRQLEQQEKSNAEWASAIAFRADVGLISKDELAISPEGIRWKGRTFPLDSITRVRWGGVRRSVNGIPVGTNYTIAFGDNRSEQFVQLRKGSTYSGFIEALWPAVCIRLLLEMIRGLVEGRSFSFNDVTVEDDAVILVRHKFFGSNEKIRLSWHDVLVWNANGSFCIAHKEDKKIYGSASYIDTPNTHILEHVIRAAFKIGARKLSDCVRS
ncbi:MAG TPA: hypothetical protein VKA94_01900, partial [Hyphomicrobiales bacterium]|nr:hypothetical protein [Hyphomicrobiales bacterium]